MMATENTPLSTAYWGRKVTEINESAKSNTAPMKACIFRETTIVGFTDGEGASNQKFRIVAYSGEVIKNHWYWGNLAFDLSGEKFDKKKTPVIEDHATSVRLGFTTMQDISDVVVVEGKFLSSEPAQKMRNDMVEGFPMQASIYNVPEIIERVEQGSSVMVNGRKLDGPGTVFRKSTIYEVSLCCLGADNRTSGEVFDKNEDVRFDIFERGQEMETKTKLTAETFAADYPDIWAEVFAKATKLGSEQAKAEGKVEGEKAVRDQFAEFEKRFGADPTFCLEQFKAGATLEAATAAYTSKLAAENAKLKEEAAKTTETKKPADPAIQAFSDDAAKKNNQGKTIATTPDGWEKEFADSADLQKEFSNAREYVAFKKAEAAGRIKIYNKN